MDFLAHGFVTAWDLLVSGDPATYSAIVNTLRASSLSIVATIFVGMPLGFSLGYYDFPGKGAIRLISDTLLALPTVVIGLVVYAFISARAPFGDFELLYTIKAIAIGQFILALPIVVSLSATAIERLDARLYDNLRSLGADSRQLALTVIYEARHSLLAAAVTAYGRVVSEVGISMMVGGNIKWHTRTITTAIALESSRGEFARGIALGLTLLAVALGVNIVLQVLRRRSGAVA